MTLFVEDIELNVPAWVRDVNSFRRWRDRDDFPDEGRIWWLQGKVWIDMSREDIFTHVLVKTRYTITLGSLVDVWQLGLFLGDGVLLSNFAANISGVPAAMFIATATLQSDRIRLIEGRKGGYVEVQGTPDMVLEVVSRSSVKKDTDMMRRLYWQAGIPEYWLVDARQTPPHFDILRYTARGYVKTRQQDGWVKSAVFGHGFRLMQKLNALKHPEYTLETRPV